ncbi:DUF1499 domain-containing protein [bacterium]|nr:DUF1499 domain-containing protein [bacterium]
MISSEGSPEYPRGWQLASYLNHWPTMSWLDSGVQVGNTPLIGRNTIALLESRFGIRFEASAGIIFGRLKSGWKVDLSDRAERPIFIDDSGVLSEQDNDAVDRSLVMGFPQDVTIRLRPLAGQTRIDIRSASRIGKHDFGDNARRIQRFAQELQVQLDAR